MNLLSKILKDRVQSYHIRSALFSLTFHYRFYQRFPYLKVNGIRDIMDDVNKKLEFLNRSKDWEVIKNESQKLQNELQVQLVTLKEHIFRGRRLILYFKVSLKLYGKTRLWL
jgi:hypothetical protein